MQVASPQIEHKPEKKLQHRQEVALLTGAHGFIGSYLTIALAKKGIRVIALPRELLTNGELMQEFLDQNPPDYIFHMATVGNYGDTQDAENCLLVNIAGTYLLLNHTKNIKYKAFINFSSSAVLLQHETFYTATKKAAEHLCQVYVDTYNLPILTVRPATVIGPGEQPQHLIPRLISSCLDKVEMPFVPYPAHDLVDVRDVVSGVMLLMDIAHHHKGQAFNIATGVSLTNKQVKDAVEKVTKRPAYTIEDSRVARSYDSMSWRVDPTPLRVLGWRDTYSLTDSIKDMVQYIKHAK